MKIHLKPLGFSTGAALQGHISRRLSVALAHFSDQLSRVVVRLTDINGPKGGVDKTCAISLEAPRREPVVVSAVSSDFYTAVDLAARRAGRAAKRAFQRRLTWEKPGFEEPS